MLRLDRLRNVLGDELMIPDFGDRVSLPDFVNEVLGIWAQHPWQYLSSRRLDFEVAATVELLELPAEVLEVTGAWPRDDYLRQLQIVDPLTFEQAVRLPGYHRLCTVEDRPSEKSDTEGEFVPWLRLPAGHDFAPGLVVLADLGPKRVANEEDVIEVPARLEPAMLALMRGVARGRFDEDSGGVERMIAMVQAGAVWKRATEMDGALINATAPRLGPAGEHLRSRELGFPDEDWPALTPRPR